MTSPYAVYSLEKTEREHLLRFPLSWATFSTSLTHVVLQNKHQM